MDAKSPAAPQNFCCLPFLAAFSRFGRRTAPRLVLEGGSIDTNGAGVLLTTEECLLSHVQERNPGVDREKLEQALHDFLGIDQVICWAAA